MATLFIYFHIYFLLPYICLIINGCERMQIWMDVNNISFFSNLMDINFLENYISNDTIY